MKNRKIVDTPNNIGIHIWRDESIHLALDLWYIREGEGVLHIYKKEVKKE